MLEIIRRVHNEGYSSAVRDSMGRPMREDPDVITDETLMYDPETDERFLRIEYNCDFLVDDNTYKISRKEAVQWAKDNQLRNLCVIGKRRIRQIRKWNRLRGVRYYLGKEDEQCIIRSLISELNRMFSEEGVE